LNKTKVDQKNIILFTKDIIIIPLTTPNKGPAIMDKNIGPGMANICKLETLVKKMV
jgi:hypothetical protein